LRLEYERNGSKITAGYRQLESGGVRLETQNGDHKPWAAELDNAARNEIRTVGER